MGKFPKLTFWRRSAPVQKFTPENPEPTASEAPVPQEAAVPTAEVDDGRGATDGVALPHLSPRNSPVVAAATAADHPVPLLRTRTTRRSADDEPAPRAPPVLTPRPPLPADGSGNASPAPSLRSRTSDPRRPPPMGPSQDERNSSSSSPRFAVHSDVDDLGLSFVEAMPTTARREADIQRSSGRCGILASHISPVESVRPFSRGMDADEILMDDILEEAGVAFADNLLKGDLPGMMLDEAGLALLAQLREMGVELCSPDLIECGLTPLSCSYENERSAAIEIF